MAALLEFALVAMPLQNEVRWRIVCQECGDVLNPFLHLASQRRELHLKRSVVVAVRDLTETHLASNCSGEHERVEREQQLIVFCELVGEFETACDELDGPAPTF
jgi:hypothetical protein